jgi:hypothetical protein
MTHTLPLVCKTFYKLCRTTDQYWLDAIVRQMRVHSDIWRHGILQILEEFDPSNSDSGQMKGGRGGKFDRADSRNGGESTNESSTSSNSQRCSSDREAAQMACKMLAESSQQRDADTAAGLQHMFTVTHLACPGMRLYQHIISHHLKFSGSIFYMPQHVMLRREIPLHFFEHRYRTLIAEVMRGSPPEQIRGVTIPVDQVPTVPTNHGNPYPRRGPQFIFGTTSPLEPGSPACIVQVRQCHIRSDGSADVLLVPIAHGWFQHVAVRPNTGNLCHGTLIKMDPYSTQQTDHRVQVSEMRQHEHEYGLRHVRGGEGHINQIEDLLNALVAGGDMRDVRRTDLLQQLAAHGVMIPQQVVSAAAAHANEEVDDDDEEDDDDDDGY